MFRKVFQKAILKGLINQPFYSKSKVESDDSYKEDKRGQNHISVETETLLKKKEDEKEKSHDGLVLNKNYNTEFKENKEEMVKQLKETCEENDISSLNKISGLAVGLVNHIEYESEVIEENKKAQLMSLLKKVRWEEKDKSPVNKKSSKTNGLRNDINLLDDIYLKYSLRNVHNYIDETNGSSEGSYDLIETLKSSKQETKDMESILKKLRARRINRKYYLKSRSFSREANLQKSHHGDQLKCTTCDTCGKSFSREANLATHKLDKQLSCKECDAILCNRKQLYDHIRSHRRDELKCENCMAKFQQRWMLTRHKKCKTKCEMCAEEFCGLPALKTHMMKQHSHSFCSKCDKFMPTAEIIVHTNCSKLSDNLGPIFQCDLCEKQFKGKRGLINHTMHIQEENSSTQWGTLKIEKLFDNGSCLGIFSEKYPHPLKKYFPLMHLHSKPCWEGIDKSSQCKDRPEIIHNESVILSDDHKLIPEVHVFYQTVSIPYFKEKIWWYKLKNILEQHISFSDLKC